MNSMLLRLRHRHGIGSGSVMRYFAYGQRSSHIEPDMKLLTYNIRMLPTVAANFVQETTASQVRRADIIADSILAVDPPYDVLCFQEAFADAPRATLVAKLRGRYPHIMEKLTDKDYPLNTDSGLLLASRLPIRGRGFQKFRFVTQLSGDYNANKGIAVALLDLNALHPGKLLALFFTHMQSDEAFLNFGSTLEARGRQFDHIRGFIDGVLGRVAGSMPIDRTAALLAGDLNVIAERVRDGAIEPTEEYPRMLERLGGPRDLFREQNPGDPGFTWDGELNHNMIPPDERTQERLDYLLAFAATPTLHATPRVLWNPHYQEVRVVPFGHGPNSRPSDHFAIQAELLDHPVIV